MKKVLFIMAACATMVACEQKGKTAAEAPVQDSTVVEAVDTMKYSGVVPAADGPGIRYELALAGDSTNSFKMKQVYLEAKDGKDEVMEFAGNAEKIEKDVNGVKKVAYKFDLGEGEQVYFLVVDDSTLRMVNDALEESENKELNYDIKLQK